MRIVSLFLHTEEDSNKKGEILELENSVEIMYVHLPSPLCNSPKRVLGRQI